MIKSNNRDLNHALEYVIISLIGQSAGGCESATQLQNVNL